MVVIAIALVEAALACKPVRPPRAVFPQGPEVPANGVFLVAVGEQAGPVTLVDVSGGGARSVAADVTTLKNAWRLAWTTDLQVVRPQEPLPVGAEIQFLGRSTYRVVAPVEAPPPAVPEVVERRLRTLPQRQRKYPCSSADSEVRLVVESRVPLVVWAIGPEPPTSGPLGTVPVAGAQWGSVWHEGQLLEAGQSLDFWVAACDRAGRCSDFAGPEPVVLPAARMEITERLEGRDWVRVTTNQCAEGSNYHCRPADPALAYPPPPLTAPAARGCAGW